MFCLLILNSTFFSSANAPKVDSQKSWDDLFLNPPDWFDNRENKLNGLVGIQLHIVSSHAFAFPIKSVLFTCLAVQINPKYPDFKNQKTYEALWLDSAPSWVSKRLEGLVFANTVNKKLSPQESSKCGSVEYFCY